MDKTCSVHDELLFELGQVVLQSSEPAKDKRRVSGKADRNDGKDRAENDMSLCLEFSDVLG